MIAVCIVNTFIEDFVGMTNFVLMRMRLILLFFSLLTGLCFCSLAQNLTNLSASQQGNEVVVNYHLEGEKGKAYTVSLYASNNNFTTPLQLVEGDVAAKRVLSGSNKTIKWRVLDELKDFDGNISFEIRAVPAAPLFTKIMASAEKVKRGKDITITWSGGLPKEQVVVEFIKDDKQVPAGTLTNSGSLLYSVPTKMKTGMYKIQLSQANELIGGGNFTVKPKYSLWIKATPFVLAGVIYVLWPDPVVPEFPLPPTLDGN